MTEENNRFQDAENYSYQNQEGLTFKQIILQHVHRISQFASVEFRGGFYQKTETPIKSGILTGSATREVYVPDTRETYSNAVECLADMLYPYFDTEMKEADKNARVLINKSYEKNSDLIPLIPDNGYGSSRTEEEKRPQIKTLAYKRKKSAYRQYRRKVCKQLFRDLCSFLHRKKYLELGEVAD